MKTTSTKRTNWNKAPLRLLQTQLTFAVFCTFSACGVSSKHLNYKKHSMVGLLYRFHVYCLLRPVLKRLHFPLPHESGFNPYNNPYGNKKFFKLLGVIRFLMTP